MNKDDCPTSSTFFFVKMSNAKATEMFPTFFQLEVILSADSPGISPLDCWLSEMAERSCAWKNEKGGACRHGQFVPFGWLLCQVTNPKNQATYCIYIYIHTVYSNVYNIYIYWYSCLNMGTTSVFLKSCSDCKNCWTKNIAPVDVANVPFLAVFCLFQLLRDFWTINNIAFTQKPCLNAKPQNL